MIDKTKSVQWIDGEREPSHQWQREWPWGLDISHGLGNVPTCKVNLPWPAPRCGSYLIKCKTCGYSAICTTAGRIDDPRSIALPCARKAGGIVQ